MTSKTLSTTCCIVGGGPAGMMLGYLLALQKVEVLVIEKHEDFFRDFRGDTVHPSTLEVFHELGILNDFLKLPHQELESVSGVFGDFQFRVADFRDVPAHCKFVALMPQWDLLYFVSRKARQLPQFDLHMRYEAIGLTRDQGRITGVKVATPDGPLHIHADLVVGCDGRHSVVRSAAQLEVVESGVPIDVLWFRINRREDDPDELFGTLNYGRALVLINRNDYFQAALIIPKGSFPEIQSAGLDSFRELLGKIAPYLKDRLNELQDWDKVSLLTVQINRLRKWNCPGLLCIGDAAHAMSPAGGVGINLAIQDAVAAANLLARPLRERRLTESDLDLVQQRREFPTRVTQFVQASAHRGLAKLFQTSGPVQAPWQFKLALQIPGLQRAVGYLVGMGVRPERITEPPKRPALCWKKTVGVLAGAAAGLAIAAVCVFSRNRYCRS